MMKFTKPSPVPDGQQPGAGFPEADASQLVPPWHRYQGLPLQPLNRECMPLSPGVRGTMQLPQLAPAGALMRGEVPEQHHHLVHLAGLLAFFERQIQRCLQGDTISKV